MFDKNIIGEANYLKTLNGDIIPLRIMLQNTNCDKISQMLTKSLQAIRYRNSYLSVSIGKLFWERVVPEFLVHRPRLNTIRV